MIKTDQEITPILGKRIVWCDIFRAICILLVVTGHLTARFNPVIYQFQVAAFFWIAGYTATTSRSYGEEIVNKAYRIMLPYYVLNIFFTVVFYALNQFGLLSYISTTHFSNGLFLPLCQILTLRENYCDWLGAAWFLPTMFFAYILFQAVVRVFPGTAWQLAAGFVLSELLRRSGMNLLPIPYLDLAGFAQFFMILGYVLSHRRIREKKISVGSTCLKLGVVVGAWFLCRTVFDMKQTIDWQPRKFNGYIDYIIPLFGILSTAYLSMLLEKIPNIMQAMSYIGKNSLGIMFFHMMFFKPLYLLLMLTGTMKFEQFKNLVPGFPLNLAWIIIGVVHSVMMSSLLWNALNRNEGLSLLLGGNKAFLKRIKQSKLFGIMESVFYHTEMTIKKMIQEYKQMLQVPRFRKGLYLLIISMVVVSLFFHIYPGVQPMEVNFPYTGTNVKFLDGWLDQADNENYRWIDQRAVTELPLNAKTLKIEGYIPETVVDNTTVSVYINDVLVCNQDALPGQDIDIQADLSQVPEAYPSVMVIEFDGRKLPQPGEQDIRTFSALINTFKFY